jgi:hypothetical protein
MLNARNHDWDSTALGQKFQTKKTADKPRFFFCGTADWFAD